MRVLIICPSEICYNPRLLKAADYLFNNGIDITVYNTITGMAPPEVYEQVKNERSWRIIENDIRKGNVKWFFSGMINKLSFFLYKKWRGNFLFNHVMNKGLSFFPYNEMKKKKYDFIIIHLVDSLPLALKLKKRYGVKLIYDSQEYFKGQYSKDEIISAWIHEAEHNAAQLIDILLATTNSMLDKLKGDNLFSVPCFRVRNMPPKSELQKGRLRELPYSEKLKLVWHGLTIVPQNIRGVHILVNAVSKCRVPVELYLQGNITVPNKELLLKMLVSLNVEDKVKILPPAHPDFIVSSLFQFDVGVIGEIGSEDNQRLTSSNKLFDFINAGLAVIVPDLPGLAETIDEYKVGSTYKQGDVQDLADKIEHLYNSPQELKRLQDRALEVAEKELFWEKDYKHVLEAMRVMENS